MKKLILKITPLFVLGLLLSCQDLDTEGISRVTLYNKINLIGDSNFALEQGTTYIDPGVKAYEEDVDVTDKVVSSNNIDANTPGHYTVSYSSKNKDGVNKTIKRNVFVGVTGDLVNSIEGIYTSVVKRAPKYQAESELKYVIISKIGTNTYSISHAIGGYYDFGKGYGSDYAAKGAIITTNNIANNDYSISEAEISGFDLVINISDFTVDATNKTISFTGAGNFTNGTFKVLLTQVQP